MAENDREGHHIFASERITEMFQQAANGRSVPQGRLEKELWQRIHKLGLEEGRSSIVTLQDILVTMFNRGVVANSMQISETEQIDKGNNKGGTKQIRLINKLCPLGKILFERSMA